MYNCQTHGPVEQIWTDTLGRKHCHECWKKKRREAIQRQHARRRVRIFDKYGVVCGCCGETELEKLCLSFQSSAHRATFGSRSDPRSVYRKLDQLPKQDNIRVLCNVCVSTAENR